MCPVIVRRVLVALGALALLAGLAYPVSPAAAAHAGIGTMVRHRTHLLIYGYLMDQQPSSDAVLDVYSKRHNTTYHILVTPATVVKVHTQLVHRAALHYGLYVAVTCQRRADGVLVALTVHIELKHHRLGQTRAKKKHG